MKFKDTITGIVQEGDLIRQDGRTWTVCIGPAKIITLEKAFWKKV